MLTPYDDLPCHQVPTTLDHVSSSDPRWFERYWFVVYERGGAVAVATGMGQYKNMNTADGFGCAVTGSTQFNGRFSRTLRPDFSLSVGPLRYEVLEGLYRIRLVLEPGVHDVSFDLEFVAEFDAFEEDHHFRRVGGMTQQDYVRFYQHGRAQGTVTVAGATFESDSFWSFRDRSFGVRPGMGGPMPTSAPDTTREADPSGLGFRARPALYFGCAFATDELAGCCTFAELHDGSVLSIDGRYVRAAEHVPRVFTVVTHDLRFFENGVVRDGRVTFVTADGDEVAIELEPLAAPFVYPGLGYADGFHDRNGLGAFRGEEVVEVDRYAVGDPEHIVDQSGQRNFPTRPQLDQSMRIRANRRPGYLELVAGLLPGHNRYQLATRGAP